MPSFNLVTEKWIPCIKNGKAQCFGLQEVLVKAHEIEELFDPSPLVTISLHRLLLAILHRNFGPVNLEQWKALWLKKQWDEKVLMEYFTKWQHRFDLFDRDKPFYQSGELTGSEKHPVLHLAMEASSGNNATLFDHNHDEKPGVVSPAIAAGYVIATQAFAIGFGKSSPFYFSDSPILRGMTITIQGNTLFETLALNLLIYNENRPFPHTNKDIPIWEQDNPKTPDRNGSPIHGYLDYLTWQSRNIHLFPEGNPVHVRHCQIQQNLKLPKQSIFDPFKCYKKSEKGYVPINLSPAKAVWRDSHTLFQTIDGTYKRPEIFNFLARLRDKENQLRDIQAAYRFAAIGLATQPGKAGDVMLWRHERLPIPLKYLEDEDLIGALGKALDIAESGGKILDNSAWNLARLNLFPELPEKERLNNNQKKEVQNLTDHLSITRPYWSQLGISFNDLLKNLAEDKTEEAGEVEYGKNTRQWWAQTVRRAAKNAFIGTTVSLDRSARMLKAVTLAESLFNYRFEEAIKSYIGKNNEGGEK